MMRLLLWLVQRPFVPLLLFSKWLEYLFVRSTPDAKMAIVFPKAMHPLVGDQPGPIFAKRLEEAVKLYFQNPDNTWILVTGSRHRLGQQVDPIPLYRAAGNFLGKMGIPGWAIIIDNSDCYNGQTELVLAIKSYRVPRLRGMKQKLVIISAHYVKLRSLLCCIWLGVKPEFIWLKEETTWKTWIFEAIVCLYSLFDPDWQSPYSLMGRLTRQSREVKT